jgi:hypothetical protein
MHNSAIIPKKIHHSLPLLVDKNTTLLFLVSLKKLAPSYVRSFSQCAYDHPVLFVHTTLFFIASRLVLPSFMIRSLWPPKIQFLIKTILKIFQTSDSTLLSFVSFPDRRVWSSHFCHFLPQLRSMLGWNILLVFFFAKQSLLF